MHVHFLDTYCPGNSPVHRLDGRVKLVLTLAFIFTAALTPSAAWAVYILLFALLLSVEMLSDLGVGYVMRRAALALPFILAALPLLFTRGDTPLIVLPFSHSWQVTIWREGTERFLSVGLKSWLSVQAAIVLASCTPFPQLLTAMRAIGIPKLLVAIFGLMWRYLFILVDEALRLLRARAARSGQSDMPGLRSGGSMTWRARVAGGMAGSLFLRALERSDRVYAAMLARGYDGEVRIAPLPTLPFTHLLTLVFGLLVFLLLLLLGYLF